MKQKFNIITSTCIPLPLENVDTDQIIASQYLLLPDIEAMKQYTFESLDPDFAKKAQPGDLIVAGEIGRAHV